MVSDGEHQRDEAAYDERQHLHPAHSFPSSGRVAVPARASHLGQDVHRGDVEEGPGWEEHGHACGVDVRQGLFAALNRDTGWSRTMRKMNRRACYKSGINFLTLLDKFVLLLWGD